MIFKFMEFRYNIDGKNLMVVIRRVWVVWGGGDIIYIVIIW